MTPLESATRFSGYRALLICLAGVIGAGLLPTLMMRAMGWSNGFWLIANMWQGQGGGDSWGAIAKALQHLDTQGIDQFYEDLYYRADHQFIYSPLSLVFFRLTQFPPWIDWYSSARMNNASWWVMLAMILVLTLIIRESIVRFVRTAVAPTLPQTAGMVALSAVAISTVFSDHFWLPPWPDPDMAGFPGDAVAVAGDPQSPLLGGPFHRACLHHQAPGRSHDRLGRAP